MYAIGTQYLSETVYPRLHALVALKIFAFVPPCIRIRELPILRVLVLMSNLDLTSQSHQFSKICSFILRLHLGWTLASSHLYNFIALRHYPYTFPYIFTSVFPKIVVMWYDSCILPSLHISFSPYLCDYRSLFTRTSVSSCLSPSLAPRFDSLSLRSSVFLSMSISVHLLQCPYVPSRIQPLDQHFLHPTVTQSWISSAALCTEGETRSKLSVKFFQINV